MLILLKITTPKPVKDFEPNPERKLFYRFKTNSNGSPTTTTVNL